MYERGKISAYQMALILYPTIYSTAILFVPTITAKYAGRDMWIAPVFAAVTGIITAYIIYRLHKRYPEETIIEYSSHLIGRFPAKLLGFAYIFFFLFMGGYVLREYVSFINISFLPRTPILVIVGSIIMVSSVAVSGGIEVLGRVSQVLIPIFILPIPIFIALLVKDMVIQNIQPILENGLTPVVRSSVTPQAWFGEVFIMALILPYVSNRVKALKWSILSIITVMLSLVSLNLMCILLFGEITVSYSFPVFKAIRFISFSDFFEHLESFVIAFWILGIFVKITALYYSVVLSAAQTIGIKDYKQIVLPMGLLLILFSIWEFPSLQEQMEFTETIFPIYVPFMTTVIPALLLIISAIQNKKKDKKKAQTISAT
ncbi:endospore germination permease [Peribacillus sp. SCS-155]|uniref:GerAB/ArcD/ProY family transporter n=1 Tax=Peribacillus sedimenti TaxID=3115297 RepID=UPI003905B7F1